MFLESAQQRQSISVGSLRTPIVQICPMSFSHIAECHADGLCFRVVGESMRDDGTNRYFGE
jgi:hypothetical protein